MPKELNICSVNNTIVATCANGQIVSTEWIMMDSENLF